MRALLERVRKDELDPTLILTHPMKLDGAPEGHEIFKRTRDDWVKVVLTP